MKVSVRRNSLVCASMVAGLGMFGCGGGGGGAVPNSVVSTPGAGDAATPPLPAPVAAPTACAVPAKSKSTTINTKADASASMNADAAAVASAADPVTVSAFTPTAAQQQPKSIAVQAVLPRSLRPAAALIDLGTPAVQKTTSAGLADARAASERHGVPLQLSFARDVAAAKGADATRQVWRWTPASAGGNVAALRFQSSGAKGLRIGLQVNQLSPQAIVRFYAPDAAAEAAVSGQEILATLARNAAAGDTSVQGQTYWGPFAGGAQGVVEIELPAGVDPATTDVAVPRISHFTLDPGSPEVVVAEQKAAGACNVDLACSTPQPPVSNAVAYMEFMKPDGNGYLCTGTLVNDAESSGTPYFLTANHCVGDQTTANTIVTRWFYRASACNSGTPSTASVVVGGGAELLYTIVAQSSPANPVNTDTTFLRLNKSPPAGVMYAGWTSVPQKISSVYYFGVHHPLGDSQKISRGQINAFAYIESASSASVSASATNSPMYSVTWNSGVTEFGSSGSSLFLDGLSANPKIVGQLEGGASSCSNPGGRDFYGRFDIAYNAALKKWLNPNGKLCN